ncbi:MAG: hypothetical protein AAFX94_05055, partial [Myxococcota bacterium]
MVVRISDGPGAFPSVPAEPQPALDRAGPQSTVPFTPDLATRGVSPVQTGSPLTNASGVQLDEPRRVAQVNTRTRQQGAGVMSSGVNTIVRFTRARPPTVTRLPELANQAPVRFRPVGPHAQVLRFQTPGPLGSLAISPNVLTSNGLSPGRADRLFAALTRVQSIDAFLTRGGHLVFEQSIATGSVATHFPPGTGGTRGLLGADYDALVAEPNVTPAWFVNDPSQLSDADVDRLVSVRDAAEAEAIRLLEGSGLIIAEGLSGSAPEVREPYGPPPPALADYWSAAVRQAREVNLEGARMDPPQFAWPHIVDGEVQLERRLPSDIPTHDERRLLDIGLSSAPDGMLAQGLARQNELEAIDFNSRVAERSPPWFLLIEGSGVQETVGGYTPSQVAALYRSGEIDERALARVGLSSAPGGRLSETLRLELRGEAEAYNAPAADRRPPALAVITGDGIDAQLSTYWPSEVAEAVRAGRLSTEDLEASGLSAERNSLLSAAYKNELAATAQHLNREALARSPTRLAVVTGEGLGQGIQWQRPSDIQRQLAEGRLTDHDLTVLGLSRAENGILESGVRRERREDLETDPSEEAGELQRVISNPDSDSGALVREAVEAGHGDRLKRYVAANGTDGIGSFARGLLDGTAGAGNGNGAGAPGSVAAAGDPGPRRIVNESGEEVATLRSEFVPSSQTGTASDLPRLEPGSAAWTDAVRALRESPANINNIRVATLSDAKRLLEAAFPNGELRFERTYMEEQAGTYQLHPAEAVNNLPHIKIERPDGVAAHIFFANPGTGPASPFYITNSMFEDWLAVGLTEEELNGM